MKSTNYISKEKAILIHDNSVINISGGLPGIKDEGQLESVLTHIQNDLYYPNFEDKLTHLLFSLAKFHMFNDGNKRTSIAVSVYFLRINGFAYITDTFIVEMENIVLWLASGYLDKDLLKMIIADLLFFECITDTTKIKIINSIPLV